MQLISTMRLPLFRVLLAGLAVVSTSGTAGAASHREAPIIAMDPVADNTDFYAFRSWHDPGNVVFVMNVIPQQVPASGPNFFNLDPNVRYEIHVDTDRDGEADDVVYRFEFVSEIREPFNSNPGLPVSYFGGAAGIPPITALDGLGSEGLGLRQFYTVTEVRNGRRNTIGSGIAVPSNVGPRTMPNYTSLSQLGIVELGNGGRAFVGQREETFYIDLGSAFDSLNFRLNPPVLSDAQDADDTQNFKGIDDALEGMNVTSLAIEVPISTLVSDANATIGAYASTSRRSTTVRRGSPKKLKRDQDVMNGKGDFVQVSRLANPLVNELLIGTGTKDFWNSQDPANEAQFIDFYRVPRLAGVLAAQFGLAVPPTPRADLVAALLKYPGQDPSDCSRGNPCSELLRLNLGAPPTPPAQQKRLGPFAHDVAGNSTPDPAGWPNGRRPNDDVTDVALRVVAGVVADPSLNNGVNDRLGDGVNFDRVRAGTPDVTANGVATEFPFLPLPNPGRSADMPSTSTGPNPPLFR